jgi:hypothetical protein
LGQDIRDDPPASAAFSPAILQAQDVMACANHTSHFDLHQPDFDLHLVSLSDTKTPVVTA